MWDTQLLSQCLQRVQTSFQAGTKTLTENQLYPEISAQLSIALPPKSAQKTAFT